MPALIGGGTGPRATPGAGTGPRATQLGLIKDAVREVVTTWPAAKARVQDGGVLVWFEDAAGHQVLPATHVAFPR